MKNYINNICSTCAMCNLKDRKCNVFGKSIGQARLMCKMHNNEPCPLPPVGNKGWNWVEDGTYYLSAHAMYRIRCTNVVFVVHKVTLETHQIWVGECRDLRDAKCMAERHARKDWREERAKNNRPG